MRLINTSTRLFEECHNPPEHYAILSHTWGREEVSYHEYFQGLSKHKAGYQKIFRACDQAAYDGFLYIWIDTCCIDKSSSAELSEAINSMFRWYEAASVCFALLDDIHLRANDVSFKTIFQSSRWFSRGWTLQELLAPRYITFYNSSWQDIGTKAGLRVEIEKVTKIIDIFRYREASIAQIFSWAAARQTTRVEDRAYSLLGLTKVNMPLLYGEGKNAFTRLQLEILARSRDDSIFAWSGSADNAGFSPTSPSSPISSMLAGTLEQFQSCHDVVRSPSPSSSSTWSASNDGLRGLFIARKRTGQLVICLDCHRRLGVHLYIILNITAKAFEPGRASPGAVRCMRTQSSSPTEVCPAFTAPPELLDVIIIPDGLMDLAIYHPYKPTLRLNWHEFLEFGVSLVFCIGRKIDASRRVQSFRFIDDNPIPNVSMAPQYEEESECQDVGVGHHTQQTPGSWDKILQALATGMAFKSLEIFGLKLASGEIVLLMVRNPRVSDYNASQDAPVYIQLVRMWEIEPYQANRDVSEGSIYWSPRRSEDFRHIINKLSEIALQPHQETSCMLAPDLWLSATTRPVLAAEEGLVNCVTLQLERGPTWPSDDQLAMEAILRY